MAHTICILFVLGFGIAWGALIATAFAADIRRWLISPQKREEAFQKRAQGLGGGH